MKKILLSATALSLALTASAFAADLPSRKAPVYVPPPPPLTWNGFYAGLNIGGGWNANNRQQRRLRLLGSEPSVRRPSTP